MSTIDLPYPCETATITDWEGKRPGPDSEVLPWTSRRLAKVTRLRLVSDPGCPFWDVSYCWGLTREGDACRVSLPFYQLPRRGTGTAIVAHAKADRVHARRLGIFEATSRIW